MDEQPVMAVTRDHHATYTALWNRLNDLQRKLREERRGLDAADVIAARDCVEVLRDLLVEVNGHRFDTQHLHEKGVYLKPRLADVRLYEAAGLAPIQTKSDARVEACRCGYADDVCPHRRPDGSRICEPISDARGES